MGEMRAQGIPADAEVRGGVDLVRIAAHEGSRHDRADGSFQQVGLAPVEILLGERPRVILQCLAGANVGTSRMYGPPARRPWVKDD